MTVRDLNFDQQERIFLPETAQPVTVIGVGSVGSQLVDTLARIGCSDITAWDDDFVSSHNIPMSVYRQRKDIARPKVEALAEIVDESSCVRLKTVRSRYAGAPLKGCVAACVDTMEARADIWKTVRRNPLVPLLVDTRIAEEFIMVFAIRPCEPDDIAFYETFMYASKDAVRPMCGQHGAKYVSGTAANAASAAFTEWWTHGTTRRFLQMLCGHFTQIGA